MKTRIIIKALGVFVAIWGMVAAGQALFGGMRPTVESVRETVQEASLADWSEFDRGPNAAERDRREKVIREVAEAVNGFDFRERERAYESQSLYKFTNILSGDERKLFVELTLEESMKGMMSALDALPKSERERFVERALAQVDSGFTEEQMLRMREMGDNLLEKTAEEGFRAFLEETSADTKLDLAPLMEAMTGVMQGMAGPESFQGGISQ